MMAEMKARKVASRTTKTCLVQVLRSASSGMRYDVLLHSVQDDKEGGHTKCEDANRVERNIGDETLGLHNVKPGIWIIKWLLTSRLLVIVRVEGNCPCIHAGAVEVGSGRTVVLDGNSNTSDVEDIETKRAPLGRAKPNRKK